MGLELLALQQGNTIERILDSANFTGDVAITSLIIVFFVCVGGLAYNLYKSRYSCKQPYTENKRTQIGK